MAMMPLVLAVRAIVNSGRVNAFSENTLRYLKAKGQQWLFRARLAGQIG